MNAGQGRNRIKWGRVLSLATVLALVLPFGLVASSDAAKLIARDAKGDAKAPWDIVRVVVDNGKHRLRIKLAHRGRLKVTSSGRLTSVALNFGRPKPTYKPNFTVRHQMGYPGGGNGSRLTRGFDNKVPCGGLKARAQRGRGLATFVIPRSCLSGSGRRVRMSATSYRIRGAGDEGDSCNPWSKWVRQG